MLSSAAKSNRYQKMAADIDRRSNGYKARKESLMAKTDTAILLVKRTLNAGIRADYILMDTWFTTEPMIRSILAEGLDVIGMVKQLKQRYRYKGGLYTLPELLSTDCSLSNAEIVRKYGNRWSIECFFKASKSFMKLGTEFQDRSFDAMVSHTTIVFTRYILLEWIRRNQNDQKTYGELFFMFCDDIQDMDLSNALQGLMSL